MVFTNRQKQITAKGFTMVELIVVVVILAIAAVIAVPMVSSAGDMQIKAAANLIYSDLDYARNMAISRQRNHAVVFNIAAESYEIQVENPLGTWTVIDHRHKAGSPYSISFANDSRLNRVDIASVLFNAESSVTFDYLGCPHAGVGTGNHLNSGAVTLDAQGFTMTVNVEPVTGYISIQ